jgi:hypothetical protein
MGDLQQTDLVGPRYLRGPRGITRFYSFHTIDVVGQTVSASQFPDKQTISFFRHLIESWRVMGLPRVSQMDNATVESFNNTWQMRVLRRRCANLRAVRRCSDRFLEYYHVRKPSRSLTVAAHGTRFPGVLRDQLWATLCHLPIGFTIDPYFDARRHPALPIAKGLVSWVRKVDAHGCIEFNGAEYFIRRKLERQYVVATLSTHHRTVYIKYDGKLVKTLPFPFTGKTIDPLC